MTRNKKFALLFVAVCAFFSAAIPARAQAPTAPIIVKSNPPEEKRIKVRFEVLHMMINAIQVRSLEDQREIHTFIYSARIRDRMQALFNSGGFQYGDTIVIHYVRGSDVALDIDGRPSKNN